MIKIFECSFGSKLFGTALPTSDDDRKAIFMAELSDIVLKRDKETIQEINKEKGIDWENKELRRFLWDCMRGQTYALEMLFAPEDKWFNKFDMNVNGIWRNIIANRDSLLSRNVMPFIGFAIGQAHKYSLKGARLNDLEKVISFFQSMTEKHLTVSSLKDTEITKINSVKLTIDVGGTEVVEVMGKQFQSNISIDNILASLTKLRDRYGVRAHTAADEGEVDWKAYYHSVRLLGEVMELMDTGKITLPRPNAQHLIDIRLGKIPYDTVSSWIDENIEIAKERIKTSNLPETPNQAFWDNFIVSLYVK